MKLGDRIKYLRTDKQMTQKDLSKLLGVSEVSIRCWENETKKPSMSAIVALSNVFCVSTDYLLGVSIDENRDNLLLNEQEKQLLLNYRCLDKYGRKAVDAVCRVEKSRVELSASNIVRIQTKHTRYIPRYLTPAAAGYSAPVDGDDYEMIPVSDDVPSNADFAVNIQGNSMYPCILDGDTVYVDRDCEIAVGDIGIFCVNGAMYCKQYFIDEDKNLILVSLNPEFSNSNVFVGSDSSESVKCFGKVILKHRVDFPSYLFD